MKENEDKLPLGRDRSSLPKCGVSEPSLLRYTEDGVQIHV